MGDGKKQVKKKQQQQNKLEYFQLQMQNQT